LQGFAPHPTKTFLKKGLGTQKLLKMGVIKPRPSGEVAAQLVALTERAIICKERCEALPRAPQGSDLQDSALHPQGNFLKKVSLTFKNF